ncbi:MAG TPA: hypothetical protein VKC56_11925 [Gallionellaceae bacterium]|nr:hypothetical protein [Gallionellaceae bacterium]
MRILFFDTICYKPYDGDTLRSEPLGGAEAAVIRVAEGLAQRPEVQQVRVMQHNRTVATGDRLRYIGPSDDPDGEPTHIVVIRTPLYVQNLRARFPHAKICLWSHDMFIGPEWLEPFRHILASRIVPVCVSAWHRQQMVELAASLGVQQPMPARFIYNPVDDDLAPDGTPCENEKLVFFSSPHKGLENTLRVFGEFKEIPALRDMKLYIANPGYVDDQDTRAIPNVVNLGKLSHYQAMRHVRSSFAVLHLNNARAETFGLVHAEANAVGVPFLNSRMGATPEICPDPRQFVDVADVESVSGRLMDWRANGRPEVQVNPAFRRHRVVDAWIELLGA